MFRSSTALLGKVLVVAEQCGGKIFPATLAAITAGLRVGEVSVLLAGSEEQLQVSAQVAGVQGVARVLVVKGEHYSHGRPEEYAPLIVSLVEARQFTHVFAATSAFGKDVIPRAAAAADAMPITEVTEIKDESTFVRHMFAGNVVSTVQSQDAVKFATIRGASFERAPLNGGSAEQVSVDAIPATGMSTWIEDAVFGGERPDLQTAENIVVGGRGLKNAENFKMLYDLAEPLKAAVGATRAVVDTGYCTNDLQIGQTGKTVAPSLYLGVGVSGAIQHVAGMKDSKVIAVINNDADAPFFQVADYGLVEDLFVALPKLTELLKRKGE
ncbi:Electron transfer flavoprotein domain [Trypanosoma vivax]|uniref:Electron transfer flavoprotein subunit alpha n=1 Tax=Trypanosoma vivax (strain Y486) TaxID=1055687 RepID=G0UBZ3_TRYVY|nr:Electron transfer flavoprotein domain [Trypanosoma vivax]CCC53341.1 putative electron-transfer-flavoprotein, alpha polypeptide [Trypanosoma vivax Y486]